VKVLDLFSGIGGFSLGLERAGFETVAFCEIDPFCQKVLKKHWPDVPIYTDIKELRGDEITADVITGGYPCQPFSQAGKRRGAEDDRHLWPEMYRLIKTIRPRWVIAENVAGHISMGLDSVLSDLEAANYRWWTFVIPACAVDAKHRRDRVWIVANADSRRLHGPGVCEEQQGRTKAQRTGEAWQGRIMAYAEGEQTAREGQRRFQSQFTQRREDVSNASSQGLEGQREIASRTGKEYDNPGDYCRWATEPSVGRVANGIPRRVDRLRSLGNAVVPQIPEIIGRAIMEAEA
jgi:DNA (cytosine-5)-methyltransferase 1